MKKQYKSLDLVKFILANLVVILHCQPLKNLTVNGNWLLTNGLTRIAIPLFFCISGFLFFSKVDVEDMNPKQIYHAIKRYMGLYCVWTIMYMPLIVKGFQSEKYIGMSLWMKAIIFFRRFFFIGSYTPLWFFLGVCTAIILVWFLLYWGMKAKVIFGISALIYIVVGCLSTSYWSIGEVLQEKSSILRVVSKIYVTFFGHTNNGIIHGVVFVAMGMCVAKNEFRYERINRLRNVVISISILFIETMIIKHFDTAKQCDMMISLIMCTFFIFIYVKDIPLCGNGVWIQLRKLSTLIYGYHGLIIVVEMENLLVKYVLVLGATLLVSCITLWLSRRIKVLKLLF